MGEIVAGAGQKFCCIVFGVAFTLVVYLLIGLSFFFWKITDRDETVIDDAEWVHPRLNSPFATNGCVLCDVNEKCCIIFCVHALQVMKPRPLEVGRRQGCGCLFIGLKCGMRWPPSAISDRLWCTDLSTLSLKCEIINENITIAQKIENHKKNKIK